MVYTFTYTDCAGNSHDWTYIYSFPTPRSTDLANGSSVVSCAADAMAPTPPTILDACDNEITPVAAAPPTPLTCEGDMVYTFTYTDCAGNSHDWTYTYTIDMPDFTMPANGTSVVTCAADALAPTPPTILDACDNEITPVAAAPPTPLTCEGDMVYTFTYTDCAGNSHDWTYTYSIDMPDFTMPANGSSVV